MCALYNGRPRGRQLEWTLIRGKKPSAIAAATPKVIVCVLAMAVIVTACVFLTATGWPLAAMRRKLRRNAPLRTCTCSRKVTSTSTPPPSV